MFDLRLRLEQKFGDRLGTIRPFLDDSRTLSDMLKKAEQADLSLLEDHPSHKDLATCLGASGLGFLKEQMGSGALVFFVNNLFEIGFNYGKENEIRRRVMDNGLLDESIYEICTRAWRITRSNQTSVSWVSKTKQARSSYLAFEMMDCLDLSDVDLDSLLVDCAREDEHLQFPFRWTSKYHLEFERPLFQPYGTSKNYNSVDEENMVCYGLHVDGIFGVIVTYRGIPNAIVSFGVPDEDTLLVSQMQGIFQHDLSGCDLDNLRKYKKGDFPMQSPKGMYAVHQNKLLVGIAKEIARSLGKGRLGIQGAINNPNTKPHISDNQIHLPYPTAFSIYDGTAERMGFTQDTSTKDWYLDL